MTTQRKTSLQLGLTTSFNLWQPKERILYNFFLQQVPTYDDPKKEFLTTFSYNKFQLMTTQRKNFFTACSSYNKLQQVTTSDDNPKKEFSLQLVQVTTYDKPWNFVGFVLWCVGKLQLWGVRNPLLPQKPWRKLAVNCFPFFPICFASLLCSYTSQCMKAVKCYPWRVH